MRPASDLYRGLRSTVSVTNRFDGEANGGGEVGVGCREVKMEEGGKMEGVEGGGDSSRVFVHPCIKPLERKNIKSSNNNNLFFV